MRKVDRIPWLLHWSQTIWVTATAIFMCFYLYYAGLLIKFPYDWEPTDGDHLNFAVRIFNGLPIFLPLKSGYILSVYNPLYHYLNAAFVGLGFNFTIPRVLSCFFWLGCAALAFYYFRKTQSFRRSLFFALILIVPALDSVTLEMLNVNPNSLMAFLFLSSLCAANWAFNSRDNELRKWCTCGILCALCFFAKQQGIIAIVCCGFYLIFKGLRPRIFLVFASTFCVISILVTAYLEHKNSGQFLNLTIFELAEVVAPDSILAERRLLSFFSDNLAYVVIYVASLACCFVYRLRPTIWQIATILHIPLLFKILGNGGGGPNYLLTFWFSIAMTGLEFVSFIEHKSRRVGLAIGALILLNAHYGLFVTSRNLIEVPFPGPTFEAIMKKHYSLIQSVVGNCESSPVLAYRSIGSVLQAGCRVNIEASTTFAYAWPKDRIFDRRKILEDIRNQEYRVILTGILPYPKDVQLEIEKSYDLSQLSPAVFLHGMVGVVKVYTPRIGIH